MTGAFRKKEVPFSQVSNKALRDERLSLKAKGLYSIIQMYITIPDFILYKATLIKLSKDGKDSFNTAWKELKDSGYLIQHKMSNGKGNFYYEYELLDEITTDGFSVHGLSIHGKTGIYNNTDLSNKDLNNKENTGNFDEQNPVLFSFFIQQYPYIQYKVSYYIKCFHSFVRKPIRYKYDNWKHIVNTLDIYLETEDEELIEGIIEKYFKSKFREHSLYHSVSPKILDLKTLEANIGR